MFIECLENELNVSTTENGAQGYKTTKSALVDFNFKIPSYRNKSNRTNLILDFKQAYNENPELGIKYLFYLRDIRGGLGERDSFRTLLKEMSSIFDERVFGWILEYGRADDLFSFFDTPLEDKMLTFVEQTLYHDTINQLESEPATLLAKWMPSINSSSKKTRELAKRFIKAFNITQKEYRKTLAKLRTYIDIVEKKLCEKDYSEIEYDKVPSMANLKYNKAFLRNDTERRKAYLESLQKGETKINSSVVFPHDIVHRYSNNSYWGDSVNPLDVTLEEMWKALPDYVKENNNILVVRDGSGSMTSRIPNSTTSALNVATALAIYFSERQSGEFKDKFITFSASPKFVDLSKLNTLHDKLQKCYQEDDCSNTDIGKTFDLILQVVINNRLKQEEIPNLLIISDQEFDAATYSYNRDKLFEIISDRFRQFGYEMPKLIFWNVNSRTNTIPLTENKNGVILVSGYSVPIVNMVLSNKLNPYEALVETLMGERYKQVSLNVEE